MKIAQKINAPFQRLGKQLSRQCGIRREGQSLVAPFIAVGITFL
jgi:hypothetical protein